MFCCLREEGVGVLYTCPDTPEGFLQACLEKNQQDLSQNVSLLICAVCYSTFAMMLNSIIQDQRDPHQPFHQPLQTFRDNCCFKEFALRDLENAPSCIDTVRLDLMCRVLSVGCSPRLFHYAADVTRTLLKPTCL